MPTPDQRSGRRPLAVATAAAYPTGNPDDAVLLGMLRQVDLEPQWCIWNDSTVDWPAYDAVLIRTIWDYHRHYGAFLDWLGELDRLRVPTINDSRLVRWNSDKRYLFDLARHGVPIVASQVTDAADLHRLLGTMAGQDVVVKPTVSATARHTVRGTAGTARLEDTIAGLPAGEYLVQPFVPQITEAGEWSLMYFDGRYSHAVIKTPASGDYRVQDQFGGSAQRAVPPAGVIAAAEKTLAAAAAAGHPDHAYVRVDGVVIDDAFLVMELEMIEPYLFFETQPGAAEQLARAVARRLRPDRPLTARG